MLRDQPNFRCLAALNTTGFIHASIILLLSEDGLDNLAGPGGQDRKKSIAQLNIWSAKSPSN